ncbi:Putative N-acetylmannosamine-6-phosphate 2-epimerase [Planococcus massiliensis]|uniref:Putative N-acetylmannosamine-6-phosphate 2-epimerase n=1 Tax=Planococcus massiliensis TaxID=1499687 RepID=A0A098EJC5_9BACL|nr:Putative N-acetylmannosamine-6-phosphate 2-epimerase [Planococcus massiliensis]
MILEKIQGGLVVSCQALEDEPLHSSFIMGRMARAAMEGGAIGIRANSAADINEIRKNTNLPVIGIVKKDYADSSIFITATMKEIEELATTDCEMIAIDATSRKRPNNETLEEFVEKVRRKVPTKLLMADVATFEEAVQAEKLGFDCVSTTLIGYTEQTDGQKIDQEDYQILKEIVEALKIPVIAEGNVDTSEKAKRCLDLGAHSVVVGSAITRPQIITKRFTDYINN